MQRYKDISRLVFNRLTAIRPVYSDKYHNQYWEFRCVCGKLVTIFKWSVTTGKTKSCGCYHREIMKNSQWHKRHGMYQTRIYNIWRGMNYRTRDKYSRNYFGRGITVCKRWKKFENFLEDMGASYKKELSLDRINNEKGYNKKNCRWATIKEQARNKRGVILFKGMTSGEWSKLLGGRPSLVGDRILRGWSIEKAFTQKIMR